jgi:murein L,D-transpeptidase YcbB/YkuD
MESIVSAMRGGTERRVTLSSPLPVHIVYFTAAVDAQGGLHHFGDVYGYDARSLGQSRPGGPARAASR